MSYDEEQTRRSRVVVETPTERREVVQQQTVRYPEERRGYSTGMVVTVALVAIAATALIALFVLNPRDDSTQTNVNARVTTTQPTPLSQAPVIVTQPTPAPTPVIITQPAPVTTTAPPVIIQQAPPATGSTTTTAPPATGSAGSTAGSASAGNDDATLQTKVDRALSDDPDLSAAGVTASVINGRVTLTGTVSSDALKRRAERLATVKGVLGVDNHIAVTP